MSEKREIPIPLTNSRTSAAQFKSVKFDFELDSPIPGLSKTTNRNPRMDPSRIFGWEKSRVPGIPGNLINEQTVTLGKLQ